MFAKISAIPLVLLTLVEETNTDGLSSLTSNKYDNLQGACLLNLSCDIELAASSPIINCHVDCRVFLNLLNAFLASRKFSLRNSFVTIGQLASNLIVS